MNIRQRKKFWKSNWFFLRLLGKDFDTFNRNDVERTNAAARRAKRSFL